MPTVLTYNKIINYDLNQSDKYYRDIPLSEDFIYLREAFFEDNAKRFIEAYSINNYIQINEVCQISYGNNWLDFDEIERRAFEIAVNKLNIERHKASQAEKEEIKKQFESFKPHKSGFSDVPMPSIRFN